MKMKKWMIPLIIMFVLGNTGCSKAALTENDDPEEVLAKAKEVMEKEKHRASEIEKVYSYDDGTEEIEHLTVIFDAKKGIRQETTEYETGFEFTTYNVKENGSYYVYVQESEDKEQWIRYEEEAMAENSSYEYYAKGVDFSYGEEEGFTSVDFANEGKEVIDDTDTIRIKVTAEIENSISEEGMLVTREGVLEENGWTEEEIHMIDGFSELLDEYIAASNGVETSAVHYEEYVWVDVHTHKVVQIETKMILGGEEVKDSNHAIQRFEEACWQIEMLHNDLASGVSREEALKYLEEAKEALDNSGEYEEYDDSEDYEEYEDDYMEEDYIEEGTYYPNQIEESSVEKFIYGDNIPEVDELPASYEEMTEEEYYDMAL